MKILAGLALLLMLCAPAGGADAPKPDRFHQYTNALAVIQDKPCDVGLVLAQVAPKDKHRVKGGSITFNAKDPGGRTGARKLCWAEEDGVVMIIDEDLNMDVRPAEEFKPRSLPKGHVSG